MNDIQDLDIIKAILNDLLVAYQAAGGNKWLLLPLVPLALVQTYKKPFVQGLVEKFLPKFAWAALSGKQQMGLAFLLGALPVLAANLTVLSPVVAIGSAIAAGVAALVGYKPLKAIAQSDMASSMAAKLPSFASQPLSYVVPLDEKRLAEIRELAKDGKVK